MLPASALVLESVRRSRDIDNSAIYGIVCTFRHNRSSMNIPTFSSRDFNREPGRIKRAAADGPVIITERGRPIIAAMPFAEYERLKAPPANILDALDMEEVGNIDIDFTRPVTLPRPAVFD